MRLESTKLGSCSQSTKSVGDRAGPSAPTFAGQPFAPSRVEIGKSGRELARPVSSENRQGGIRVATKLTSTKIENMALMSNLTVNALKRLCFSDLPEATTRVCVAPGGKDSEMAARFLSMLVSRGFAAYCR